MGKVHAKLLSNIGYTSLLLILAGVASLLSISLVKTTQPPKLPVVSHQLSFIRSPQSPTSSTTGRHHPRVLGAATTQPLNCRQVPCFALTFDDGPSASTTPQILSTLEQYHVPASFFVIGNRVTGNEALLARMFHDGDEIQSHSWSHPDLTTLPPVLIQEQYQLSALAIEDSGAPKPTLLRPPYGAVNPTVINSLPVPLAMWNEDPKDWQATNPAQVIQAVETQAKPGGVVDMHDIYQSTALALPQIITDLQARGFHFVTFSQLNQPDPAAHTEYFGLKS